MCIYLDLPMASCFFPVFFPGLELILAVKGTLNNCSQRYDVYFSGAKSNIIWAMETETAGQPPLSGAPGCSTTGQIVSHHSAASDSQ